MEKYSNLIRSSFERTTNHRVEDSWIRISLLPLIITHTYVLHIILIAGGRLVGESVSDVESGRGRAVYVGSDYIFDSVRSNVLVRALFGARIGLVHITKPTFLCQSE